MTMMSGVLESSWAALSIPRGPSSPAIAPTMLMRFYPIITRCNESLWGTNAHIDGMSCCGPPPIGPLGSATKLLSTQSICLVLIYLYSFLLVVCEVDVRTKPEAAEWAALCHGGCGCWGQRRALQFPTLSSGWIDHLQEPQGKFEDQSLKLKSVNDDDEWSFGKLLSSSIDSERSFEPCHRSYNADALLSYHHKVQWVIVRY